jgi:sialic acid synthase SpsE
MLIAECCQNHLGKPEILLEMVSKGAAHGATHLKIQGLYHEELTFRERFEEIRSSEFSDSIVRPFEPELRRLEKLTLDFETEVAFVQECKKREVIPMITVFTHKGLDRALKAGFKSFKIASYDCASLPLIERILESCEELVISTGATFWHEINSTVNLIKNKKLPSTKVTFLHAVTEYPTEIDSIRLLRMTALKNFGFPVGFSDHTAPASTSLWASALAIKLGASAIERHFTILDPEDTKDGPVSVNCSQLSSISKMFDSPDYLDKNLPEFKTTKSMLAPLYSLDPSEFELKNRDYYRGRVASVINGVSIPSWEDWPIET